MHFANPAADQTSPFLRPVPVLRHFHGRPLCYANEPVMQISLSAEDRKMLCSVIWRLVTWVYIGYIGYVYECWSVRPNQTLNPSNKPPNDPRQHNLSVLSRQSNLHNWLICITWRTSGEVTEDWNMAAWKPWGISEVPDHFGRKIAISVPSPDNKIRKLLGFGLLSLWKSGRKIDFGGHKVRKSWGIAPHNFTAS